MDRTIVRMDRPIYVGLAILDISKTTMSLPLRLHEALCSTYRVSQNSLYRYKLVHFDDKKHRSVDRDNQKICAWIRYFQLCWRHWGIPRANNKISGLFKDKNGGSLMTHFIGLGSKCYTFRVVNSRWSIHRMCAKSKESNDQSCRKGSLTMICTKDTTIGSRKHELTTAKGCSTT